MAQNASDSTTHFSAFDGNGDVMALVNADTGAVSVEYEYGPFGESVESDGRHGQSQSVSVLLEVHRPGNWTALLRLQIL